MNRPVCPLVSFLLFVLLAGCATTPDHETPTVSVTGIKMLPAGTMTPRFQIDLHIVNPDRKPLELEGIAYSIYIEDHKIFTGAANELPVIEPFGEGEVTLYAVTNIMGSMALINDLLDRPRREYHYRLDAKLAPAGRLADIRIVDEGTVNLGR